MTQEQAVSGWTRPVAFPEQYTWLVLVSGMDLMLTWLILQLGGREVNPVAEWVLHTAGHGGLVVFKFAVVIFVILVCEFIARRQRRTARELAWVAVIISAAPVVVALAQLVHAYGFAAW